MRMLDAAPGDRLYNRRCRLVNRARARCSCNRASYPGDGVAVGGAALAGTAQLPKAGNGGDGPS